jgi:hypothetical protein
VTTALAQELPDDAPTLREVFGAADGAATASCWRSSCQGPGALGPDRLSRREGGGPRRWAWRISSAGPWSSCGSRRARGGRALGHGGGAGLPGPRGGGGARSGGTRRGSTSPRPSASRCARSGRGGGLAPAPRGFPRSVRRARAVADRAAALAARPRRSSRARRALWQATLLRAPRARRPGSGWRALRRAACRCAIRRRRPPTRGARADGAPVSATILRFPLRLSDSAENPGNSRAKILRGSVIPEGSVADEPQGRRFLAVLFPRFAVERRLRGSPARGGPSRPRLPSRSCATGRTGRWSTPPNPRAGRGRPSRRSRRGRPRGLPDAEGGARRPAGDEAALLSLALWCRRWCPWTAPDGPDGMMMDVTGAPTCGAGSAG